MTDSAKCPVEAWNRKAKISLYQEHCWFHRICKNQGKYDPEKCTLDYMLFQHANSDAKDAVYSTLSPSHGFFFKEAIWGNLLRTSSLRGAAPLLLQRKARDPVHTHFNLMWPAIRDYDRNCFLALDTKVDLNSLSASSLPMGNDKFPLEFFNQKKLHRAAAKS